MRPLKKDAVIEWLRSQGETWKLEDVLSGFDFDKPLYEHQFWPGDEIFQLARLPSLPQELPRNATDLDSQHDFRESLDDPSRLVSRPPSPIGNWFGLRGITTRGVAINDGLAGRQALRFEVIVNLRALEGAAAALRRNIGTGIGGPGGQTQIFIPSMMLNRLECRGQIGRW